MKKVIDRKCNACKQSIKIHRDNVEGVVHHKNFYYHTVCFCELAEHKAKLKSGKPAEWQSALEHIEDLEREAKELITRNSARPARRTDCLNDYLIAQYNVSAVPNSSFWMAVNELENGFYKGRRCKKVPVETLLEAWKWGQRKLDEINKKNKIHHRGPQDDSSRILYDFAILVTKIPNYLAYKAKQEAEQAAAKVNTSHINYNNIQKTSTQMEGLDDISDMLDDF